ncbi:MAG TPA: hypothetical protein VFN03_01350, partial [Trueperaceae bacterium]|nr:hypothetical protein [Trueperaceae bacterium]
VTGVNGTATPTSTAAFVDLFLTLFADGWFGVGLVAALVLTHFGANARSTLGFGAAAWLLTLGLALRSGARVATDAYGVQGLDLVERCGGLVAACGWLYLTLSLLTDRRSVPRPTESGVVAPVAPPSITDSPGRQVAVAALWLLALKAVVEAFVALPFGEELFVRWNLRVLLLHAFLLGAVTLGLVAAIRTLLSPRAFVPVRTLALSVLVLLVCLVPLTGLWPTSLAGRWMLWAAAVSSLLPALVVAYAFATGRRSARVLAGPHGAGRRRTGLTDLSATEATAHSRGRERPRQPKH